MNILFITSNRLGDAVLSTGLLDHILRGERDANVTIVCGPIPAPLFEGLPCQKTIIPMIKKKYNRHWIDLWTKAVAVKWDMVVDMRDSAVSRLVYARKRHIHTRYIDRSLHKVEQCAAVMGLDFVPDPRLWPSLTQRRHAEALVPDGGPVLAVGPTANWIGKIWPAENFIEVINHITGPAGILPGARVAVFAAPGEEEGARTVLASVPAARQIDVIAKTDAGTAAAALGRCALYIGNDSGLMHCAAAAGIPTVGLFGPSYPELYAPWGENTVYITTPETYEELINFEGYDPKTLDRSLMTSLSSENVVSLVQDFWKSRKQAA